MYVGVPPQKCRCRYDRREMLPLRATYVTILLFNCRRTDIRVNELLHIRPCDLEYHTNRVRILKAKGDKQRRVPLKAGPLAELQAYIKANNIGEEAPIFPITQQWVRAIINKYGALIDRNIHPHTFRHSFAINSVRHGVDTQTAAGAGPF